MSRTVRFIAMLAIGILADVSTTEAQSKREKEDATLRADCRLALQTLVSGRPQPRWDWALSFIQLCDDTAGEALPAVIRRAPTDSLDLLRGLRAAIAIKDQRILDAAVEVARNPSLHWRPRVSALHLLAGYVDASTVFEPDDLTAAPNGRGRMLQLDHVEQQQGTHPLAPNSATQISSTFGDLAATEADPRVRATAKLLAGWLAPRSLAATPLAAQAVDEAEVALAWRNAPPDSASLSELYRLSSEVRDQRVLDAVMAVSQDPAAGWWRRATAMRVMAAYVSPGRVFWPDHIRTRADSALRRVSVRHWVQREGSVPFAESWIVRVRIVLQRVAGADTDPEVRHTANYIAESLRPQWPATGRKEAADSAFRAVCRRAARIVIAGRAESHWQWAADRIGECDDSAGEAIPVWLRRATTDSLELLEVIMAARGVRDRRILDAAVVVARDGTLAWRQRVSAMHVLGAFVDPNVIFEPDDLTSRSDGTAITHLLGHAIYQIDGTRPLSTGYVLTIRSILDSVATESTDPRVSSSARLYAALARNREIR